MVLRIKEDTGIRTAKLFINNIRRLFSVPEKVIWGIINRAEDWTY